VSLPADCQSYGIEEFVLNTMICAGIHGTPTFAVIHLDNRKFLFSEI
jgi:hypothetical protein